jgi:hypothetical protein
MKRLGIARHRLMPGRSLRIARPSSREANGESQGEAEANSL